MNKYLCNLGWIHACVHKHTVSVNLEGFSPIASYCLRCRFLCEVCCGGSMTTKSGYRTVIHKSGVLQTVPDLNTPVWRSHSTTDQSQSIITKCLPSKKNLKQYKPINCTPGPFYIYSTDQKKKKKDTGSPAVNPDGWLIAVLSLDF